MKPIFKKVLVPTVSAVAGGIIVLGALKLSPAFASKLNSTDYRNQNHEIIYDNILRQQNGIKDSFDDLFNDNFFGSNDPFKEMKKMREQMEKHIERLDGKSHSVTNPFDSWFSDKFGGGSINDIAKREDDNFVYYDIKIDDVKSTSINTKIENGYITITGTTEKKSGTTDGDEKENNHFSAQSIYKSTFNRTFPLPDHVDQDKMQMASEKDKVVLKFPKVKA